jgi:cyanuric acid amidohydrolase
VEAHAPRRRHRIPCRSPGDTTGLQAHIASGRIVAADIVAVMGKTEGNGCVNDFTREYATTALAALLGTHLHLPAAEVEKRVAFVMSGGTEGVLSPHVTVFSRKPRHRSRAPAGQKRLTLGIGFTRDFRPEEMGRRAQVEETAKAVRRAMDDAGIDDRRRALRAGQVPPALLQPRSATRAPAASTPSPPTPTSRWATRAAPRRWAWRWRLGEIQPAQVSDAAVLRDWSLASSVASASAGIELDHNVVIVLGMSAARRAANWSSRTTSCATPSTPARCGAPCRRWASPTAKTAKRVVNVFAKAEASPDGLVREQRHTMLNDSDINSTRHARAVGAVIASVAGRSLVYVSGGAEHQGPAGGGPVAVIARA